MTAPLSLTQHALQHPKGDASARYHILAQVAWDALFGKTAPRDCSCDSEGADPRCIERMAQAMEESDIR